MHLCVFASHWSVGDSLSSQLSRPIRVFLALAPPLKSSRARETKCCLHSVLGMTHWDNVDRHQCQCTAWRLDWECGAADVNLCSNIYSGYSGIVGFFFSFCLERTGLEQKRVSRDTLEVQLVRTLGDERRVIQAYFYFK